MDGGYLGLRWGYDVQRAEIAPQNTALALKLAQTISRLVREELFVGRSSAVFDRQPPRTLGSVPLVQCVYPSHDSRPRSSTAWMADTRNIERVADPRQFGSACAVALGEVIAGTNLYDPRFFTTGHRFLTRNQVAGYAAYAAREVVAVPRTNEELAVAMASVANVLAWEVSGGDCLPAINFVVNRDRT